MELNDIFRDAVALSQLLNSVVGVLSARNWYKTELRMHSGNSDCEEIP